MDATRHIPAAKLASWVVRAFARVGLTDADAKLAADMLVQTSLWGIDSHGVARATHYLNRLSRGSIVARPTLAFTQTAPATGQLDGGHGLGLLVCEHAMGRAIELAREAGVGVVGVSNSSHCGAIGLYTRQATRAGMIGIAFTHSDSFVVPHGGKRAFFGTNPISIAIPTENPVEPFCVDMATSVVPWNRIMNARRENKPVASGVGVDAAGEDCTDPHQIVAVKPAADHKGYALAYAIDLLCGPLNGMNYGSNVVPMYSKLDEHRRLGSLMIAIDPLKFAGGAVISAMVAASALEIKQQSGKIMLPGDPEYNVAKVRGAGGIPVEEGLMSEFTEWSKRLDIEMIGV